MANNFPTDKNVYDLTDTVIRQTECQYNYGEENLVVTLRFAGVTGDVVSFGSKYRVGTRIALSELKTKFDELSALGSDFKTSGKVTASHSTTKQDHGEAVITIAIPYSGKINLAGGGGGEDDPEFSKSFSWQEKSTRYQFGLQVYAGDVDEDSNEFANAGAYSGWLAEESRNAENYAAFKYTSDNGTTALSGRTLELAKKHYAGIENVERAYPEVIRTTNYVNLKARTSSIADLIDEIDENPNLYQIDTTPVSAWIGKFPYYSWLKTTYDVEATPTEYENYWNVTVTEGWMGVDEDERGPWDENLYSELSANRWKFYTAELTA